MRLLPLLSVLRSRAAIHRGAGLAIVLLVTTSLPAHAQSGGKTTSAPVPAEVIAAHRFALSVYPDLATRPVSVAVLPLGDGQVVVEVRDRAPAASTTSKKEDAANAPLVTATVAFDSAGRVKTFAAAGPLVETERNQQLQKQIAAHPEWNEQAMAGALQNAGGLPATMADAPSVAALGSNAMMGAFFGQTVVQDTVRFRWKGDSVPVNVNAPPRKNRPGPTVVLPANLPAPPSLAVPPTWVVEVTADPTSTTPTRYRLEYEPFGGRLISVVRQ